MFKIKLMGFRVLSYFLLRRAKELRSFADALYKALQLLELIKPEGCKTCGSTRGCVCHMNHPNSADEQRFYNAIKKESDDLYRKASVLAIRGNRLRRGIDGLYEIHTLRKRGL